MKTSLFLMLAVVCAAQLVLSAAWADDLEGLKLPAYRNDDGYGLGVTEYSFETNADLLEGESPEHSIELSGLLQAPDKEDALCFSSTLIVKSVEDARGRDIMRPQRKKRKDLKFNALIPSLEYKDRRGEPLQLCETELDAVELNRPGSEVAEMVVVATTVVVKQRTTEEIDAEVSDRYYDIGLGSSIQVSSMEIGKKSEMTVKLKIKHTGNKDIPVIDSVIALDSRGKPLGGGRWTNELELFAKSYDVELKFPLKGQDVAKFQVILATEYDIEQVELTIEDLFQ
jgi:hypothetical protein